MSEEALHATQYDVRASMLSRLAKMPHVRAAGTFFRTVAGRELLEALSREFVRGEMAGKSVAETYFNLGAREVALYLERLARLDERERTGEDHAPPTRKPARSSTRR